jgi:hypothetical protein
MKPEIYSMLVAKGFETHLPPLFRETREVWRPQLEHLVNGIIQKRELFMNEPLDATVLPAVLALQLHQFQPVSSCEGHIVPNEAYARTSSPYIELRHTIPWPQYENEEQFWLDFGNKHNIDPAILFPTPGKPNLTMTVLGDIYFQAHHDHWSWGQFQEETDHYKEARVTIYQDKLRLANLLDAFYKSHTPHPLITIQFESVHDFIYFLHLPRTKDVLTLKAQQEEMLRFGEYLLARYLGEKGYLSLAKKS